MTLRKTLLVAAFVLGALLVLAGPVGAADCFRYAGDLYVCDARPRQAIFSAPGYQPNSIFVNRNYAWLDDNAPLYAEPHAGAKVTKEGEVGLLFYTIEETVTDSSGATWYKVDDNEWARGETMHPYTEPNRTGVLIHGIPERPFGWVMQRFHPAPAPDVEPPADAPLIDQYTFVQLYGVAEGEEGWLWFDIGDGQWVKQTYLALVDVTERPEGVGADEFWVSVDLFEQVFAAYEGDRMVYAGLTATGLEGWETNEGLFSVYARHREWPMWGDEDGDYYFLQDVPHTMFFDDDIALHGAYWHDSFGAPRSHGCVNMTPRDAEWVWYWSENAPNDLWVYVFSSPQDYFLQQYGDDLSVGSNQLSLLP
ncbi:MAG TPA: L,D-transpeptidase [Candidatus Binatia bacterium]|nr:L,D-transpeptidase [Candidatus Binatia bacterium]